MQCSHCKLDFPTTSLKRVEDDGRELYFCCHGCEGVYFFIKEQSFLGFYERLGNKVLAPPKVRELELAKYDSAAFAKQYLVFQSTKTTNGVERKGGGNSESHSTVESNLEEPSDRASDFVAGDATTSKCSKDASLASVAGGIASNTNDSSFATIHLLINGTYCSACFWLIEKALENIGIYEVSFNHTSYKATLHFDTTAIKTSQIFDTIERLGYHATPYNIEQKEAALEASNKALYTKLVVSIFCMMNIMWLSVTKWVANDLSLTMYFALNIASLLLSSVSLFYCGSVFLKQGIAALRLRYLSTDLLLLLGMATTYLYSLYNMALYALGQGSGETYFESIAMITTFILAAKVIELRVKLEATTLLDEKTFTLPSDVRVLRSPKMHVDTPSELASASTRADDRSLDDMRDIVSLLPSEVEVGDVILLEAGETLACDSELLSRAHFNLAAISGESADVELEAGMRVLSGCICLDNGVRLRALATYENSYVASVVSLLENSLLSEGRLGGIAQRISAYFSVAILLIAALAFAYGYYSFVPGGFEARGVASSLLEHFGSLHSGGSALRNGLFSAISVIIIACPCALSLALPIARTLGLNVGFNAGILFKDSTVFEGMGGAKAFVFDKTGTLTSDILVVRERYLDDEPCENLGYLRALLANSHPVSLALSCHLDEEFISLAPYPLDGIKQASGGLLGWLGDREFICGNMRFIKDMGVSLDDEALGFIGDEGSFAFVFASIRDSATMARVHAIYILRQELREDAREVIDYLRSKGKDPLILSGDERAPTRLVASSLGIPYIANASVEDKLAVVSALQRGEGLEVLGASEPTTGDASTKKCAQGSGSDATAGGIASKTASGAKSLKTTDVVMIGDGINDAPALKAANISITLGQANTIALTSASIIILNNRLLNIINIDKISKTTHKIMLQNLALSLGYNAIVIPFAFLGFINPIFAAFFMSISSLCVVGNSLRIRGVALR